MAEATDTSRVPLPRQISVMVRVVRALAFCVIAGACLPLSIGALGVQVVTPYIPFLLLMFMILFFKGRPGKVTLRTEEWVFLGAGALTVAFSGMSGDWVDALAKSVAAAYGMAVYLVFRYGLIRGVISAETLWGTMQFLFWFLALVALVQTVTNQPFGAIGNYFGDSSEGARRVGDRLRVSGTFSNANVFAQVFSMFGALVVSDRLFRKRDICQAMAVSALNVGLVAAALSRSGVLFVVVLHSLLYLYWAKTMARQGLKIGGRVLVLGSILFGAAVSGAWLVLGSDAGLGRLSEMTDSGRIETYLGALELLQSPAVVLFGVGSGQFFEASEAYNLVYGYKSWMDASAINSSVHNWTLQVLTENGVVVLGCYVYALARTARRGLVIGNGPDGPAGTLALIIIALYGTALQFGTTGTTPWLLTHVAIILVWIQSAADTWVRQQELARRAVVPGATR